MALHQSPRRRPNRGDLAWFQALRDDWEQYQPPPLLRSKYRQQLVDFYQQHNPKKLDSIDATLRKFEGQEEELFVRLRAKYESHRGFPVATPGSNDPRVFLEVSHGTTTVVRVDIQLYQETAPLAAENFRRLCTGQQQLSYRGCSFHRIVAGMCVQGGDITKGDGTGGRSAYHDDDSAVTTDLWGNFPDDTPYTAHAAAGYLSMANNGGPNQNGSQFFFTLAELSHLNGKHVVFGRVVEGLEHVLQWGKVDVDQKDRPREPITIVDCGEVKTNEDGTERLVRASSSGKGSSALKSKAGPEASQNPRETVPLSNTFGSFKSNPSPSPFSFGITSPQAKSPFASTFSPTPSTPITMFGVKNQQDQSIPSSTKSSSPSQEGSVSDPNGKQSTEPQDTITSSVGFGSGQPISFETAPEPLSVPDDKANSGFSFNTTQQKTFSFGQPVDVGKPISSEPPSSFATLSNDQKSEPAVPDGKPPGGFSSFQQNPSPLGSQEKSSGTDGSAGFAKSSFSFGASSEPLSFAKLSNDLTSTLAPADDDDDDAKASSAFSITAKQMPTFGSGTSPSPFTSGTSFSFGSPASTLSFSTPANESKSVFISSAPVGAVSSAPKDSFGFHTTGTSFAALSATTTTLQPQLKSFGARYRDSAVSDDDDTSREDDDSSYNGDESSESDDDDDDGEYSFEEDLQFCVATPAAAASASPGAISVAISPPAESILSTEGTVQTPTVTNKTEPFQVIRGGVATASPGNKSRETFGGIVSSTESEKLAEKPLANVPNKKSDPYVSLDRPAGGSTQNTDGASQTAHPFQPAFLVEREHLEQEDIQEDTPHERPVFGKKKSGRKTSRKGDGDSRPVESIELPPGLVPERSQAADQASERADDERNLGYATPDEMSQGAPPITPGGASQTTNRSGNDTVGTDVILSSIATWESSVSEQFEMLRKDIDDSASDILRAKTKLTEFQGQIDNRQVTTPKNTFTRSLLSTPEREKKTKQSPSPASGPTPRDSSFGSTDSGRGFLTYPSPDRPTPSREPLQHVPSGEEVLSWTLAEGEEELDDESPKKDLSVHSSHILIEDETLEVLQKEGGSVDVLVEKFDEHLQSHVAKQRRL